MTPKPRLCVTYTTAGISNSGSLTGTCTTFAIAASGDPQYSDAVYKRHGTTTLFAALSLFDGTVIGRCMQRHRHLKFIRFLNAVERQVAAGKPKDHIGTKLALEFIDLDPQQVKNIAQPIKACRITDAISPTATPIISSLPPS